MGRVSVICVFETELPFLGKLVRQLLLFFLVVILLNLLSHLF